MTGKGRVMKNRRILFGYFLFFGLCGTVYLASPILTEQHARQVADHRVKKNCESIAVVNPCPEFQEPTVEFLKVGHWGAWNYIYKAQPPSQEMITVYIARTTVNDPIFGNIYLCRFGSRYE